MKEIGRRCFRSSKGCCPELVRTLPALIFDDHRVEDCNTDDDDHAADALRYGLMSRSAPKAVTAAHPPGDFDAASMLNEITTWRRLAHCIGHEREFDRMMGSSSYDHAMRRLHLARLRGPSDT